GARQLRPGHRRRGQDRQGRDRATDGAGRGDQGGQEVTLRSGLVAALLLGSLGATHAAPAASEATGKPADKPVLDDPIAKYVAQLTAIKLIDAESGTLETLRHELGAAELLLRDGAFSSAAVALYAIVKSPRYAAFTDFVEYQNAEYDLGVALARAGSFGAALDALEAVLRRGPAAPYWGPAHCPAVGGGVQTRGPARLPAGVLAVSGAEPDPR